MRDVEDGEVSDALRMQQSSAPGDGGAPIMSREKDFFLAELVGDGDDVGDEFGERVRRSAGWLAAQVIAALVGDDHAKSGGGQWLDLFVPRIPEFRKAVEKDHDRAGFGAGGDGVEGHSTQSKREVF